MSSKSRTVHSTVLLCGSIIAFKVLISFNLISFGFSPLKATSLIHFSTAVIVFWHGFLFFAGKIPTDCGSQQSQKSSEKEEDVVWNGQF